MNHFIFNVSWCISAECSKNTRRSSSAALILGFAKSSSVALAAWKFKVKIISLNASWQFLEGSENYQALVIGGVVVGRSQNILGRMGRLGIVN